jgi:hypothetical protein
LDHKDSHEILHHDDVFKRIYKEMCPRSGCEKRGSLKDDNDDKWCAGHSKFAKGQTVNARGSMCEAVGCTRHASIGLTDKKGRKWCSPCKYLAQGQSIISKTNPKCRADWCCSVGNSDYDWYCKWCFIHLNPLDKRSFAHKSKETALLLLLQAKYPDLKWVHNQAVGGGSLKRPDFFLDCGSHWLVKEMDEFSHRWNACLCEWNRLLEIHSALRLKYGVNKPLVVIRLNPDAYTDTAGNRVPSCFEGNDVMNEDDWKMRIEMDLAATDYWLNTPPQDDITIIEICYDKAKHDSENMTEFWRKHNSESSGTQVEAVSSSFTST